MSERGQSAVATDEGGRVELTGLTSAEVATRVADGRVNRTKDKSSRTFLQILRGNIFTLFNGILAVAIVVVLAVGQLQDAVFGLVIVVNAAIGVFQEYRAKRTMDKLAVVHSPHVMVIRDSQEAQLDTGDLVADDVYQLKTGDQVPTDAHVLAAHNVEVDESLLTGESDPVVKNAGDAVMSGSFLVSGAATVRATGVGADSYASRLTSQARRFSLVKSELRGAVNRILIWITWIIGPVIVALVWSQISAHGGWKTAWNDGSWREAIVGAVAGVVGMIPEGLVLLTSISFGLAAITLARRNVMVQELPAVEGLARVDVICLDKTGTLTAGDMAYDETIDLGAWFDSGAGAGDVPGTSHHDGEAAAVGTVVPASAPDAHRWGAVLHAVGSDPQANATAKALAEAGFPPASHVTYDIPFSSARKWSALSVDGEHWVFGGPDVVLRGQTGDTAERVLRIVANAAHDGKRALLLARVAQVPTAQAGPADPQPVALVTFREKVRPDAADTLRYFADQGVGVRVISGDNPTTVAAIARSVGVEDSGFDARDLPEDIDELAKVLDEHRVFGRVTPEQKRAMVHALQHSGHTVAMTGDGVNDALALKDADLGIAMGSGAEVTKAVARLVLLDGQFSRLPGVVAEGRRVIANVERVSNLFLTKTTYAATLAIMVSILGWAYPFLPRHLTLVGGLTIGIPAFFLALAPNKRRYKPGFLGRVLSFAVPCGLVAATAVLVVYGWTRNAYPDEAETAATLTLLCVGLWVLGCLARPWVWWRIGLVATMALAAVVVLSVSFLSKFYAVSWPTSQVGLAIVVVAAVACVGIELIFRYLSPWLVARQIASGKAPKQIAR